MFSFEELADLRELFSEAKHSLFSFEEFLLVYQNAAWQQLASARGRGDSPAQTVGQVEAQGRFAGASLRYSIPKGGLDNASPEHRILKRNASASAASEDHAGIAPRYEGFLQDKFITRREDRFVLPIKENAGAFVPGIVQSHSGSGSTLFIEPQSVVPLNNELQLLKQEEKREIFRIFTAYTAQIKEKSRELLVNQGLAERITATPAALGRKLDAKAPRIVASSSLKLLSARHPLLILRLGVAQVIPFDLGQATTGADPQPEHRGGIYS